MKKLLSLVLVLALASLASAVTLDLVDNGDGTYGIDVLSPGMSGAADGTGVYWVLFGADPTTDPETGLGIYGSINAGVLANMVLSANRGDFGDSGLSDYGLATYGEFRATNLTYTQAAGNYATGFIALPGATEIVLYIMDENWESISFVESIAIPEPATIALLCLGGLLIRKK